MKRALILIILTGITLSSGCRKEGGVYENLRKEADNIKVINTHEHQRWTSELPFKKYGFYQLLYSSYLAGDVRSAGSPPFDTRVIDTTSADELWNKYGKYLGFTSSTNYYGHFVKGFNLLYNTNIQTFTKENIKGLSDSIAVNYENYPDWFGKAFRKCGYELIILDQYWDPLNTYIDQEHFALAFNINVLIETAEKWKENAAGNGKMSKEADSLGLKMTSLEAYLELCDHFLKKFYDNKAVALKNSEAYSRSLYYEKVSEDEARMIFKKGLSEDLSPAEKKKLEDFMFRWIIERSVAYQLPVQIHTGYLAGNGNNLTNGDPVKLNNLFIEYPQAKFILFHGGFPWTAEYVALGKMFPNVYLDLVWLPQISRSEAVRTFDLMLDCVPYNKIMWGGDCHLIEESAGSLEYAKDVVCEVLAARVGKGQLAEKDAVSILKCIFRENAAEIFDLEKRLTRSLK